MTQEEMKSLLELHEKWLFDKSDGVALDLSGADLRGVDLSDENLSYANLSGTNLSGADLSGADLKWANTLNAKGLDVICVQLNTSDKNRQIQYYVQLDKVTVGCFRGTLDELKKAVDKQHEKESIIHKRYQIAFKTIEDILDTY